MAGDPPGALAEQAQVAAGEAALRRSLAGHSQVADGAALPGERRQDGPVEVPAGQVEEARGLRAEAGGSPTVAEDGEGQGQPAGIFVDRLTEPIGGEAEAEGVTFEGQGGRFATVP